MVALLGWLRELQKKRLDKKEMAGHLRKSFEGWDESPLGSLLTFLRFTPDLKRGRGDSQHPTLAKTVLGEFLDWWKAQSEERRQRAWTESLVPDAFGLMYTNPALMETLDQLYKVSQRPGLVLEPLRAIMAKPGGGHVITVLELVEKLRLETYVRMGDEVLFPLALHNHRKKLKEYLQRHPEHCLSLGRAMEECLGVGFREWPQFLRRFHMPPGGMKYSVRDRVGKFLDELVAGGMVREEDVPGLTRWRTGMQDQAKMGCLLYLAQTWYAGEISEPNFVDIVHHVLEHCPDQVWPMLLVFS